MSDEPEILYVSKGLNIIGWQLSLSLWGMSLMWFYAFVSGIINKQPLGYEFYVFTPIMAASFLIGLYMIRLKYYITSQELMIRRLFAYKLVNWQDIWFISRDRGKYKAALIAPWWLTFNLDGGVGNEYAIPVWMLRDAENLALKIIETAKIANSSIRVEREVYDELPFN
ncbi:MAG: hypothetical protein KC422_21205 [Trueperaceae bacterium]|nr:hypothetical protein [Trueperaceae bacterium]